MTTENPHEINEGPDAGGDVWKAAYERERQARQMAERLLDEKTREVQNSLDVMRFHFEEVMARNKELQVLSSIASITQQQLSFQQCIGLLVSSVSSVVPCVYAQAYFPTAEDGDMWQAFGPALERVNLTEPAREMLRHFRGRPEAHHREALESNAIVETLLTDRQGHFYEVMEAAGIKMIVTLPVIREEHCVAIVEFGFVRDELRESEYLGVLKTAVHQIAIALERRHQEERLEQNFQELKKTHEELKQAKNQLVHSEKMVSLGQLSAGVAHEINNPVGFVLSNFGSLKDYKESLVGIASAARAIMQKLPEMNAQESTLAAEEFARLWQKEDIDFLLDDLDTLLKDSEGGLIRVRDIVASLKDFARTDNEQFEVVNLEDLLEKSIRLVWNEVKYTAKLERAFENVPAVKCNSRQISQVVVNLIVNASQALNTAGTITIKLKHEGDFARIDVEDTGSGIPQHLLDRIFEPFFTTKPVGVGTGLGLSIAYGILQAHNGRIEVNSTVDVGTRFSLFLPLEQ